MKKKLIIIGFVVILLAVGLCGCNGDKKKNDDVDDSPDDDIQTVKVGNITVSGFVGSFQILDNITLETRWNSGWSGFIESGFVEKFWEYYPEQHYSIQGKYIIGKIKVLKDNYTSQLHIKVYYIDSEGNRIKKTDVDDLWGYTTVSCRDLYYNETGIGRYYFKKDSIYDFEASYDYQTTFATDALQKKFDAMYDSIKGIAEINISDKYPW